MKNLSLDLLDDHPANANQMNHELYKKLIGHISDCKHYPPLIVRPHPQTHGRYQILDGHHRAKALRQLGHCQARCDVWDVDETQADMLLLTLNRLCGDDDPYKRGEILKRLSKTMDIDSLAEKLSDDSQRIRKLIQATKPPPQPLEPRKISDMPHGVIFFLTATQKSCLFRKLKLLADDRSVALIELLELDCKVQDQSQ